MDLVGKDIRKMNLSQSDKAEECILKGIKILDEMDIKPWCSEGYLCLGNFT